MQWLLNSVADTLSIY